MVELSALWLPILLSGVAVFLLSFVMWMVSPHHRPDWRQLPDEDAAMGVLGAQGVHAGQYTFPHCSDPSMMKDPTWLAKYNAGPKGYLVLLPEGPPNLAKNLVTSFLFNVATAWLVAYVACLSLAPGAEPMEILRLVGTVAFLANSFGLVWGAIWFGRTWISTLEEMADGLVYAAATAALFLALWPAA